MDDGQKGRESLIGNLATEQSKQASQIASGYAIRTGLVQKMAPGDKTFHVVALKNNKIKMHSSKTRVEGDKVFLIQGKVPKILMSGETGDILLSSGDQNSRDQLLGMFLTQRYQGKYFGKS